jgi:hypothetical protein
VRMYLYNVCSRTGKAMLSNAKCLIDLFAAKSAFISSSGALADIVEK